MKKSAVLALGAAVLSLCLSGCAVNPVTGRQELSLMSEAQELKSGSEAYPVYTQASGGEFKDQKLNEYVNRVGKSLASKGHRPGLPYEFNVVNDSGINAYALPGGKISITRGLLTRMDNEAQLAAVLGHEAGHVTARHAAAGYTRQVLAGVLLTAGAVALESSDVEGAALIAGGGALAANLVLMKYSRDQERQSDELGLDYMLKAGYNPEGIVQTMEILKKASGREASQLEAMMASHPLTSERIDTARREVAKVPASLKTEERLGRERFQEATAYLRTVAPAYEKAEKGMALVEKGQADEGLKLLRKASQEAPREARIRIMLASAEFNGNNPAAAEWEAARAVELDPDLFDSRFTAGVVYFKRNLNKKSLEELQAAEKIVPGQPQVAFFRGRNYEAEGSRDKAAREFSSVLKAVNKGPMAEYSHKRLTEWGYIKKPAAK